MARKRKPVKSSGSTEIEVRLGKGQFKRCPDCGGTESELVSYQGIIYRCCARCLKKPGARALFGPPVTKDFFDGCMFLEMLKKAWDKTGVGRDD